VTGVLNGQVAVIVDLQDVPAVAVLDPVGRRGAQPAVVLAGDDELSERGLIAVREAAYRARVDAAVGAYLSETVGASLLVQLAD
jgi:hypothetical protein